MTLWSARCPRGSVTVSAGRPARVTDARAFLLGLGERRAGFVPLFDGLTSARSPLGDCRQGPVREAAPPPLAGWPASIAALRRAFSRLMKAPISNLDRAALRALLAVERDVVRVRHELT